MYHDIYVKTGNPAALDTLMNSMGAVVEQDASGDYVIRNDGVVKVRCYGDVDYLIFAIEHQGYGEVKNTND